MLKREDVRPEPFDQFVDDDGGLLIVCPSG
jgi:hypothetical protein